ncbi:hypothetical protein HFV04_025180 [Pseudomonas sp. BIGb0427]|uniref:hypothetical protein n=1 Tax=unclassified Pseudomonas TaxID=196821 RepID=UPI001692D828|nr:MULTISPECIES: hypothetical protein [unclassified Pseudomonas]NLU58945.1 hypothetical protein [Pseudomonas sp. BIGb0427]QPG62768.1 hypothetical protein HFV04_025180 [Pseudomonas sp. BIGb0427]UVM54167.1 hypothetical protein LOY37_17590 [Pseudomonas sp. B21-012]UVM65173.1 hypothetical protein LOY34_17765 [Pseudomonas sp. B21-009]
MSDVTQLCYALILIAFMDHCLKPYLLRKWLGLALMTAAVTLQFVPGGLYWHELNLKLFPLFVLFAGMTLVKGRRKFQPDE